MHRSPPQYATIRAAESSIIRYRCDETSLHAGRPLGIGVAINRRPAGLTAYTAGSAARWACDEISDERRAEDVAGGVVYAMTDAAIVYGLNTSTGAVLWSATAPPETFATQTSCAVANGWLYVGFGTAGVMSYAPRRHTDD